MNAPRRLLDDPGADPALQRVLGRGAARPLDEVTRRRLRGRLARAAALPAVAAWWLFVKSALAALGVVGVAATAATVTGVVEWRSARPASPPAAKPLPARAPQSAPLVAPAEPEIEPTLPNAPTQNLNPTPPLPAPAAAVSAGASLAQESALLEQARREMRRSPGLALQIADEHGARFPRGQLASERALLQVEALHRLGRDAEARLLAAPLLKGASGDLYRERVGQLLGEKAGR